MCLRLIKDGLTKRSISNLLNTNKSSSLIRFYNINNNIDFNAILNNQQRRSLSVSILNAQNSTNFKDQTTIQNSAVSSFKSTALAESTVENKKEIIDLNNSPIEQFNNNPPELIANLLNQTHQNVNNLNQILSASDIGLNPYLLPRLFYDLITNLHDYCSFTWVTSIAILCIALRILTFPLYIKTKKESVLFSDNMIKMQKEVQSLKIGEGTQEEQHLKGEKAMKSITKMNRSFPRFIVSPVLNGIVFSSFYFCLRAMANHPIESMKLESFLWVPSLVNSDPYYLFPFLTSFTMFLMLKFNMESSK